MKSLRDRALEIVAHEYCNSSYEAIDAVDAYDVWQQVRRVGRMGGGDVGGLAYHSSSFNL